MSISTRRGDDGTTGLLHGPRLSKAHPRLAACGDVDELGSHLGVARAFCNDRLVGGRIETIQRELWLVAAELGTPPDQRHHLAQRVTAHHVARLDEDMAEIEAVPGLLDDWALPGATRLGALLDVARAVCRRAERSLVALVDAGEEPPGELGRYLNRLSDLLWLYARWHEHRAGADGALRPPPAKA